MFFKVFLVVLVIVALCFLGLGVQTFFSKKKKFPDYEVGHNKEMRKRGIYCMRTQQMIIDKELIKKRLEGGCDGCELVKEHIKEEKND